MSKETISRITDKGIEELIGRCGHWMRSMPRSFINAILVRIRHGQVAKQPIYTAIGVTLGGERNILGLWPGQPVEAQSSG